MWSQSGAKITPTGPKTAPEIAPSFTREPKVEPRGPKSSEDRLPRAPKGPTKRQTEPRTSNIPKPPASQVESLRDGPERAVTQGAAVVPRRGGQLNPPPLP